MKELVTQAENFHFNANISLKHWLRAAETLYQEVIWRRRWLGLFEEARY